MSADPRGKPSGIGKIALTVDAAIFTNRDNCGQRGEPSHTMELKLFLNLRKWRFRRMPVLRERVQANRVISVQSARVFD
jgi:hypothetical protein